MFNREWSGFEKEKSKAMVDGKEVPVADINNRTHVPMPVTGPGDVQIFAEGGDRFGAKKLRLPYKANKLGTFVTVAMPMAYHDLLWGHARQIFSLFDSRTFNVLFSICIGN